MGRFLSGIPLALLLAPAALAQAPQADVRHLALLWATGDFRAPLICQLQGTSHRVVRRVQIRPVSRASNVPLDRIRFFDLEAPPGTRCQNDLGAEEPNLIGTLELSILGRQRPDTARHDFQSALRRDGGFRFDVHSGRLKIGAPGKPMPGLRVVDFRGGSLELKEVKRGSDSWRRLAEFGPRRKLSLELKAPDGTRVAFDLVQLDGR